MMKVSNASTHHLQQIYQNQTERAGHAADRASASAGRLVDRRDSVELSSHAQLLQQAAQAAEREDPERLEKIAHLRTQVQNDTYTVPVQQLVQRMIKQLF